MEEVIRIAEMLSKLNFDCGTVELFVFGSVVNGDPPYSDIDVLVVYDAEEALEHVRGIIRKMDIEYPLDVIYMSRTEENETKFVERQRCTRIFPPCHGA